MIYFVQNNKDNNNIKKIDFSFERVFIFEILIVKNLLNFNDIEIIDFISVVQ